MKNSQKFLKNMWEYSNKKKSTKLYKTLSLLLPCDVQIKPESLINK